MKKNNILVILVILLVIHIFTFQLSHGQDNAEPYNAEDFFDQSSDANYIKNNIIKKLPDLSDVRLLAIVYNGEINKYYRFIALVRNKPRNPYGPQDQNIDYKMLVGSSVSEIIEVKKSPTFLTYKILKKCIDITKNALIDAQTINLLKVEDFNNRKYCSIFVRSTDISPLMGAFIVNPALDTKSYRLKRLIEQALNATGLAQKQVDR